MASRKSGVWQPVVASTIVAVGLAVLWAMVGGWTQSTIEGAARGARNREDIYVSVEGTPVISVASDQLTNSLTMSRRTIEGESFPLDYEHWLQGAYLAEPAKKQGLMYVAPAWTYGGRIGGGTDGRRPPTSWYAVRDASPAGHCYFVGYDAFSKQLVGYIGRSGFSAAPPSLNDQFELPGNSELLNRSIATTQYFDFWGVVWNHQLSEKVRPAGWLVFLTESDKVWRIDLRKKTAEVAMSTPKICSISIASTLEETANSMTGEGSAVVPRQSPFRLSSAQVDTVNVQPTQATGTFVPLPSSETYSIFAGQPDAKPERKMKTLVAVRTLEKIVFFDNATGRKKEFSLPPFARNEKLSVYWIAPEKLLTEYTVGNWSHGTTSRLIWSDPSGKIERTADVKLAGWVATTPESQAWAFTAVTPIPIGWLVALLLVAPLTLIQYLKADSYSDALTQTLHDTWPQLIVVVAIGAVLAWLVLAAQRKYFRPGTGAWVAFVLLLGVPGFLAYWLHHRRAKLEECAECGKVVPRDRDACAACEKTFRAPAKLSTEIFA